MEHLIAALAGGAAALWFTAGRRREGGDTVRHLGAVEFLLDEARDATLPPGARLVRASRRTDRQVARLDAMIRSLDARDGPPPVGRNAPRSPFRP
jgi:hypothetical protein